MQSNSTNNIHMEVQDYYGKTLSKSTDLKTNACCCSASFPSWQKKIISEIEDEVIEKFYGCGSPIPLELEGKTVLDLGCGSGRDVYIASKLVGENGFVIGVDMTDEQLAVANKYVDIQTKKFGFAKPNVIFKKGIIEDLKACRIEDNSIDVIISNCVINLSDDKETVFKEIFRVLKPGGELYFSDVFTDRRIPKNLKNDPVLYGECLSNAMYVEDFRRMLRSIGILDYRITEESIITIENKEVEEKIGFINFTSLTVRAFKINSLEDICEDYGQIATYKGTIEHSPHKFMLDDHHLFETGKPMLVCGNTADMLSKTRFAEHFNVVGNKNVHFGTFPCDTPIANRGDKSSSSCNC